MNLQFEEMSDNSFWIYFEGDLDVYNINQVTIEIQKKIKNTKNEKVVFDLKKLNYLDSSGIGLLVKFYKYLKDNNKKMQLYRPTENVLKLIKMTKLDKIIEVKS
ncbi:STAS domain-containing protein [Geotoga petraea]|jgi:anti-anti-sigma factor|uniref:Anti-sigma factor antagonist n=1 Tax=Geotoga petraea TaxID=28234 RepID=A0A1G6PLP1_9BACT|nr:STAS domain-containing protein [Geotoga petraea]MDK2946081.1 anti-sigma factor antagonist [Geotoga sp.]TGG87994.1 anti-sigma factor antagonist [Geotoga petraea]SDC80969.1 anti-sigma B factor antagonist [Geotoga petraea]